MFFKLCGNLNFIVHTNGSLQAGINVALNGMGNAIDRDPFFQGALIPAAMGFASGAITGYQLAKQLHANVLTGSLDPSLDYIVKSEYGNSIYSDYGIGAHGSEYHVARNTNLPDGFSTSKGYIRDKDGNLLWGFVNPVNKASGNQILGSDVYFSRKTIKNYFLGDQPFALEQVKHEFFHLKDYFSGNYLAQNSLYKSQGLGGNDLKNSMTNWLEFRAYNYNYYNLQRDFFLERMEWHANMPFDMFWSIYGY